MVDAIRDAEFKYWNQPELEKQHALIAGPTKWEDSEGFAEAHWDMLTRGVEPLPETAAVLDIGCGIGRMLKHLRRHTKFALSGVDISPNMLKSAREYIGNDDRVVLKTVVDEMLPFPGHAFDFVYSIFVFQHIPARARIHKYLEEIHRVLKPGGQVRIQTCRGRAHPEDSYGYTHGSYYPAVDAFARDFENAGLTVTKEDDGLGLRGNSKQLAWIWVTAKKEAK